MRALLRVSAAVLLVLSILWLDTQLTRLYSNRQQWEQEHDAPPTLYDGRGGRSLEAILNATSTRSASQATPSPKRRKRPSISDLIPNQYRVAGGSAESTGENKLPERDRVIVVGKLKTEDTDWIADELSDWQHAIYTVDDPTAPLSVPQNKGRESNVYLQYIIDHYHALPSTIVFLHSHRDGYPEAWHTEFSDHSNVRSVRNLQTDFVQRTGYANLRCNPTPGCPDEIRPFREPGNAALHAEHAFADVWRVFFNNTRVPDVVAAPCCAQFAVSRAQVRRRPLGSYLWYHRWLMETELADDVSGRVMEYLWHVIFGQEAVYCPDMEQCFNDVYGLSVFDE